MGGVTSAVKQLAGGGSKPAAPAVAEEVKKTATTAETEMAKQRQASMRARRGMGGLVGRMFGSTEDKLGG
jgi:hypothetical protein